MCRLRAIRQKRLSVHGTQDTPLISRIRKEALGDLQNGVGGGGGERIWPVEMGGVHVSVGPTRSANERGGKKGGGRRERTGKEKNHVEPPIDRDRPSLVGIFAYRTRGGEGGGFDDDIGAEKGCGHDLLLTAASSPAVYIGL